MSHWSHRDANPLSGRRVVVTRPQGQAEELCNRLRALEAEPVLFPVIAIAPPEANGPLDQAVARLANYDGSASLWDRSASPWDRSASLWDRSASPWDWIIFTSVNGVEHFWARLTEHLQRGGGEFISPPLPMLKIAAIGPATAEALHQRGALVHLMPAEYRAEAILDEIGDVAGQRILLPRADIARPTLADGLRALGAQVDEVAAYRTVPGVPPPPAFDALRAGVDVITFTSSSTVRNFVTLTAGLDYGDPLIACIGPVTATTARELGLHVDVVAKEYTIDGLLNALISNLQPLGRIT